MGRVCGIDLGTTNSLIGHGEELYTGLVSSSVDVNTRSQVSRDTISKDVISSYKVNMTTGESGKLPIVCSSVILRELVNRASRQCGEYIDEVVISVPAKFSHTQRQAVYDAAEMAGLTVRGLINEPTAAAIQICKDTKDLVVVYDLGGGTFDVTILDSRAGNYFVVATDGDGYLAGDNFDTALAEVALKESKVKVRFKNDTSIKKLKTSIRLAKEAIQRSGMDQFVDMSQFEVPDWKLTLDTYKHIMKETFSSTVRLTKELIQANLMDTETPKLVFVGGSTACPFLREWVEEEVGIESIKHNEQPDYVVAKGVALYAKMVQDGTALEEVDDVTKCLCIENDIGMAEVIIEKNTLIPVSEIKMFDVSTPSRYLEVKLYQGDALYCKDNDYVGTLMYDYGEVRQPGEGIVEVEITVDHNGRISLACTDILNNVTQKVALVMR